LVLERFVTATCLLAAFEYSAQPQVIDERRLAGMTIGDPRLEREVLDLFQSQAAARCSNVPALHLRPRPARLPTGSKARPVPSAPGGWRGQRNRSNGPSFEPAMANAEEIQLGPVATGRGLEC
jgi:hypothetical protein